MLLLDELYGWSLTGIKIENIPDGLIVHLRGYNDGLRPGRGCINQLFILRQLFETRHTPVPTYDGSFSRLEKRIRFSVSDSVIQYSPLEGYVSGVRVSDAIIVLAYLWLHESIRRTVRFIEND